MLARYDTDYEVISAVLQGDEEPAAAVYALRILASLRRDEALFADTSDSEALADEAQRAEDLAAEVSGGRHEIMMVDETSLCEQALLRLVGLDQTLQASGDMTSVYGDLPEIARHAATVQAMYDVEPGVTF